jgi:hypothetical protein
MSVCGGLRQPILLEGKEAFTGSGNPTVNFCRGRLSAVGFRRLDQYLQVGGLVVQQRLEPVADAIVERPGCVAINPMNLAQSNGDPPPNATMPSQP